VHRCVSSSDRWSHHLHAHACLGAILDLPLETINDTFQTNVMSALRLIQAVVPHMAAQKTKGIVVNVGSVGAFTYAFVPS
jgi:short-subunit dehydrogenase